MKLFSPAKVNLFLKIVGKRPDGYHNLASLFQTISLCDLLHFNLSGQDSLTCTDPTLPLDQNNLIWKATNLFRRKTGRHFGVSIHLEKHIPIQSGLGGGSGNAATTLWALNRLCGEPVSLEELAVWSAGIGSDIPFFFSKGTAYCTARGEEVRDLSALPSIPLWLIKPKEGLSTPEVYRNVDIDKISRKNPEESLNNFLSGRHDFFNDLEIPAFKVRPELGQFKQRLASLGFDQVLMTGSGSCFVCIGDGKIPSNENLYCQKVNFLNREGNNWYNLDLG